MTCHRHALIRPRRPRGLAAFLGLPPAGAGAVVGPIRAALVGCGLLGAVGVGVGINKLPPAAPPAATAPAALGLDRWADPVAIPAPPALALFGLAVAGLALLRR